MPWTKDQGGRSAHSCKNDFLELFRALNGYLVALCGAPVDRLSKRSPGKRACLSEDVPPSKMLLKLRPKTSIEVVRSIRGRVSRSHVCAHWLGRQIDAPHPAVGIATAVDFFGSSRLCSAKTVIGQPTKPIQMQSAVLWPVGKDQNSRKKEKPCRCVLPCRRSLVRPPSKRFALPRTVGILVNRNESLWPILPIAIGETVRIHEWMARNCRLS